MADDYDRLIKVVVMGDAGVGKSDLVRSVCGLEINPNAPYQTTVGIDFSTVIYGPVLSGSSFSRVKFQIWDTAGQERFRSLAASYFRGAMCIVACYSTASSDSLRSLDAWLATAHASSSDKCSFVVAGLKTDLAGQRQVPRDAGLAYARAHHASFVELSSHSRDGLDLFLPTVLFGTVHEMSCPPPAPDAPEAPGSEAPAEQCGAEAPPEPQAAAASVLSRAGARDKEREEEGEEGEEAAGEQRWGVDLVFVVDETGSMGGQIQVVKERVTDIVATVSALPLCGGLRVGLVGYRDHSDAWVSCVHVPLTADLARVVAGVDRMAAGGGGDYPEAVADGLYELVRLGWRAGASKTAVLIADAPPHGVGVPGDSFPEGCPCGQDWLEQVQGCREMGIVVHAVACKGLRETDVWRRIARDTHGQYFELSDYSLLPPLIAGVAESDLSKLLVVSEVLGALAGIGAALRATQSEDDRLQLLLGHLSSKGVTVQHKPAPNAEVVSRPLEKGDVEQAVCALRRAGASADVSALFPQAGLGALQARVGLFSRADDSPVPLKKVEASARIRGLAAEVVVSQTFTNEWQTAIEATYRFPVDPMAAVTGFVAEVDGKRIVARCMTKAKAAQRYEDAIASGAGAYLLEQKAADVFCVSVGNLPAGKSVVVSLTYVVQLQARDRSLRFVLPMTIAPKYCDPSLAEHGQPRAPASRDRPCVSIGVEISAASPATQAVSPTHDIAVEKKGDALSVRLREAVAEMSTDFVLELQNAIGAGCSVVLEEWEGPESLPMAAAAVFCPEIGEVPDPALARELVVLLDCSASMAGGPLRKASDVLEELAQCLGLLPPGTTLNIVTFGSRTKRLFIESQSISSPEAAQEVAELAHRLRPDHGGTQLASALQVLEQDVLCPSGHVMEEALLHELDAAPICSACAGRGTEFDGHPFLCPLCDYTLCGVCSNSKRLCSPPKSKPRAVLLITDGAVWQEEPVVQMARKLASKNMIYPLGVGHGVSQGLLYAIAAETNGAVEFCTPEENVRPALHRHLRRMFASVGDVAVEWDDVCSSTPRKYTSAAGGTCVVSYALLERPSAPVEVTLKGTFMSSQYAMTAVIDPSTAVKGGAIHRLCARSMIREMEVATTGTKDDQERAIVDLALKYSLASQYTSFVAVEHRNEAVSSSMIRSMSPKGTTKSPATLGLDAIRRLLKCQNADGSFELDGCTAVLIGGEPMIEGKRPKEIPRAVWTTCLVLVVFTLAKDHQLEWQSADRKAREWLCSLKTIPISKCFDLASAAFK
eukprot:m51a1_g6613 hypothetical protein (1277) ;mRNA; f:23176-27645